jgi:hypothetical protein
VTKLLGKAGFFRHVDKESGSSLNMKSIAARLVVMAGAATFLVSAPANAGAQTQTADYSPWAALSAFAAPASSQALCGAAGAGAAVAAAAATAQAGTPGCVFPTLDAPVAPPVAETAPLATPAVVAAGGGIGILPLLLGLAVFGGAAALLIGQGEGQTQLSISP